MTYLFAYGTLMRGEIASAKLSDCKCLGKYRLENYAMYDVADGAYPGIVKKQGESVIGEVYEVSELRIPELDVYEDEGSLYRRQIVMVSKKDHKLYANAYVYNQDIREKKILREGWNPKDSDYVWYAGYGSNLSNERFLYYIKGGYYPITERKYTGCNDKKMWISEQFKKYSGKMYFAKKSSSWDYKGVAFYNPDEIGFTYMKLFKITREQFHDIQLQEGPTWYGRMVCLDVLEDNCPVYTITNENKLKENAPGKKYLNFIEKSLIEILGENRRGEIINYLNGCMLQFSDKIKKLPTVKDGTYQAHKLQAEKIKNIVRIFDEYNNFQFDLTDEESIENCRNVINNLDPYKWGYDFDLFYKFFVLGEDVLPFCDKSNGRSKGEKN